MLDAEREALADTHTHTHSLSLSLTHTHTHTHTHIHIHTNTYTHTGQAGLLTAEREALAAGKGACVLDDFLELGVRLLLRVEGQFLACGSCASDR